MPASLTISETTAVLVILRIILEAQSELSLPAAYVPEKEAASLPQSECAAFEPLDRISGVMVTFLVPLCALQQGRQSKQLHF